MKKILFTLTAILLMFSFIFAVSAFEEYCEDGNGDQQQDQCGIGDTEDFSRKPHPILLPLFQTVPGDPAFLVKGKGRIDKLVQYRCYEQCQQNGGYCAKVMMAFQEHLPVAAGLLVFCVRPETDLQQA